MTGSTRKHNVFAKPSQPAITLPSTRYASDTSSDSARDGVQRGSVGMSSSGTLLVTQVLSVKRRQATRGLDEKRLDPGGIHDAMTLQMCGQRPQGDAQVQGRGD